MAKIYKQAERVVVWLGRDGLESRAIMEFIPSCEANASLETAFWWMEANTGNLNILRRFSNVAYWSRLWVVQEFLLGKDLLIAWGDRYIHWNDLSALLGNLRKLEARIAPRTLTSRKFMSDFRPFNEDCEQLLEHREELLLTSQQPAFLLSTVVLAYYWLKCQDKIDKIYGLLALV